MIKGFLDYLFPTVISKSLSFLLIPYMIANLDSSEYGRMGLIFIFIYFTLDIIHHSVSGYYSLHFFKPKKKYDQDLMWLIISEQLIFLLILLCIFLFIYFFYSHSIWINGAILLSAYMIIFSKSLILCFLSHFKMKQMTRKYAGVELLDALVTAGLTVLFFEIYIGSVENRLLATGFGAIGGCLLAGMLLDKKISNYKFNINFSRFKEIFIFGVKLYPHVFGSLILLASDRLFLSYYHPISAVGHYTVAFQYASIILILNSLSTRIFQPMAYEYFSLNNSSKGKIEHLTPFKNKYIFIMIIVTILFGIFINLFSEFLLPGEYSGGLLPSMILLLAFLLYWIATITVPFIIDSNKNQFLSYSTTIAVTINLLGNFILVPSYATIGASSSTLISILVAMLFQFFVAGRIARGGVIS